MVEKVVKDIGSIKDSIEENMRRFERYEEIVMLLASEMYSDNFEICSNLRVYGTCENCPGGNRDCMDYHIDLRRGLENG